jgi:hypothetical protein
VELCDSTGDQHAGKWIRDRVVGVSNNLAAVIDADSEAVVSTQRGEVDDLAVPPEHGFDLRYAGERIDGAVRGEARNISANIDALAATACASGKGAEVGEASETPAVAMLNVFRVQERIVVWEVGIESGGVGAVGKQRPVFVQIVVEGADETVRPSESADIDEPITGLVTSSAVLSCEVS